MDLIHAQRRSRATRALGMVAIVMAMLMFVGNADAARRKGKGKRKAKRPAAAATQQPAPEAAPAPAAEPAPTPAADTAPAPTPAADTAPASTTEALTSDAPAATGSPAQDGSTPSSPPPEPADAASTGTSTAAPPAAEAMQPPAESSTPEAAPEPAAEPSEMKIRAGVNAGIMRFAPGPSWGLNLSARAGVRLNDLLAAYLDGGWALGLGGGVGKSSVSVNVAGYWRVGPMGELNLGPLFLSVGPELFKGSWAGVKASGGTSGGSSTTYAASGYFPSAVGRLGLKLGGRSQFTLALEGMLVFGKVTKVDQAAGTSGASQSVKTGDSAMADSELLVLGWDLN